MPGRVFISCGQRANEGETAREVFAWFSNAGFSPYMAIEAQSIQDINSGIIGQLRRADYYVFIDFRRESLGQESYRGSLFSHQELAIAYALGFPNVIFLREEGVLLEGISAFIASNATTFKDRSQIRSLIANAVEQRSWFPGYSRNLHVDTQRLQFSQRSLTYGPFIECKFLYCEIVNRRADLGAFQATARLQAIWLDGESQPSVSPIRSPLKITGHSTAFEQTIWPESSASFDLLCVKRDGVETFVTSSLDAQNVAPIIRRPGRHRLDYEVIAIGFERLRFSVQLTLIENARPEALLLNQE